MLIKIIAHNCKWWIGSKFQWLVWKWPNKKLTSAHTQNFHWHPVRVVQIQHHLTDEIKQKQKRSNEPITHFMKKKKHFSHSKRLERWKQWPKTRANQMEYHRRASKKEKKEIERKKHRTEENSCDYSTISTMLRSTLCYCCCCCYFFC